MTNSEDFQTLQENDISYSQKSTEVTTTARVDINNIGIKRDMTAAKVNFLYIKNMYLLSKYILVKKSDVNESFL